MKGILKEKRNALLSGDYVSFGSIPERGDDSIVNDNEYLSDVYHLLKKKGYHSYIMFNKGLVKDLHYYTGIIFECYVKGIRHIVASGGRYDDLLGKYGYKAPAVGFALNMSALSQGRH